MKIYVDKKPQGCQECPFFVPLAGIYQGQSVCSMVFGADTGCPLKPLNEMVSVVKEDGNGGYFIAEKDLYLLERTQADKKFEKGGRFSNIKCGACGVEIWANDKFCRECGRSIAYNKKGE